MKNKIQLPFLVLFLAILADIAFPQFMHWRKLNVPSVDHIVVSSSENLYASSWDDRTLYKSTDDGNNWTTMISNLEIETIEAVGIDTLIFSTLDRKLYFSLDGGITYNLNNTFNSRIYTIRYINYVDSSLILLGTVNGFVHISRDFGNSWIAQQVSTGYVYSIRIIQNRIYTATNKGLFFSDNSGQTWQNMIVVEPDEPVFDIEIDSMNNLYVSADYDVYKSTDSGTTWTMSLNHLAFVIKYSPEGEIFAGAYRTINQGLTWERVIPIDINDISIKDSVTFMVSFDGGLYREELNPYLGYKYFPLAIGNIWQYTKDDLYSWSLGGISHYTLKLIKVLSDTIISNKQFYKVDNAGSIQFFRYGTDNILYQWLNSSEYIYMNFNLIWGETFQFYGMTANVSEGFVQNFGNERFFKGFAYTQFIQDRTNIRFIDSIGLYYNYFFENGPLNSRTDRFLSLIDCLVFIDDSLFYYSNYYQPQILFTPVTTIDTLVLNLDFNVNHTYSIFSSTGSSRNFIKDVWIEYFYAKQDSATLKDSVTVQISENSTLCNATIIFDSLKFAEGFKFYYAIYARDKALIPQISRSPETDYYELIYVPDPVGVSEEKEKLFSFNLSQNYPNPFNPVTKIKYSIPSVGTSLMKFVQLKVYDILGNEVATLVNEAKPPGVYEVEFNATAFPSGIYFYRLIAGSFVETKKMILLR
ncbi:MAG TPA: T9SS type A sorting domain-containing protein [Ignavibacteriaceae bacterium]|nr:T9SS type A sorting domain-containing protein [Ignavibacteriaceae bacterium]